MEKVYHGCYPTMITPFTDAGKVDFKAIAGLVDWYIQHGAHGIFAVCQSSEMFFLSPQEKIDIAKAVLDANAGRVRIVASGHTSDSPEQQIDELGHMAETGVEAVVLVSNRLAGKNDGDDVFMSNFNRICNALPDTVFGLYECPYPFLKLFSDDFLRFAVKERKLVFVKDVSGSDDIQRHRAEIAKGSDLSLFNAHTDSVLASLRYGYDGYNGIMANYHLDLYRWLYDNFRKEPVVSEELQDYLSITSMVEARCYPVSAKWFQNEYGVRMSINTRSRDVSLLNEGGINELRAIWRTTESWRARLGIAI